MREHESHREIEKQDSLSIKELTQIYNKPWSWIIRRIAPLKESLDLEQPITNLSQFKVPKNVLAKIPFITETDTPANGWLTVSTIARNLDVDYKWVNRRILFLSATGEWRIDDSTKKPRFHLPPTALNELQQLRNAVLNQFEPGTHLNLTQISNILGRHRLWVTNRLEEILLELNEEPKLGLNASGKTVEYYPQEVVAILKTLDHQYESGADWHTIPMLAKQVNKDREWVQKRLEELNIPDDYRLFSQSGRVDLCYNDEALEALLELARQHSSPEDDWFTENAIAEITGKSHNWVRKRLKKYQSESRYFQDTNRVPRRHYPPEVLDQLDRELDGRLPLKAITTNNQETETDEVAQLHKAVNYGRTMSLNTLKMLGISESEITTWKKLGLLTNWPNGQYYITNKAITVLRRAEKAEELTKTIISLESWLD